MNAEIEYPIFQQVGIRGVFFFDGGNAYQIDDSLQTKLESFGTLGFGIRWFSPMGPLPFEWDFPLRRETLSPAQCLISLVISSRR